MFRCMVRQEGEITRIVWSGGFTLIEILIVVAILTIAAVMAVPMMTSADSVQLSSAANMVAADLEYAKSFAITNGQSCKVVFDTFAETYRIEDSTGNVIEHPVKKGFDYVVDFTSDNRISRVSIESVDFNLTGQVQFDCLGSPDNGGTITLDANGQSMTVNVEPVTGFISITD